MQLKKSIDIINEHNQQLTSAFKEMQESYQQLRDSQQELVARERKIAVKEVSTTATHEMNQPLTVIQGYFHMLIESLDKDSLTAMQQKFLNRIEQGLKKLIDIISKFTKHSHLYFPDADPNKWTSLKDELGKNNNQLSDRQESQHS
jgi:signal transduction histidine kinase